MINATFQYQLSKILRLQVFDYLKNVPINLKVMSYYIVYVSCILIYNMQIVYKKMIPIH